MKTVLHKMIIETSRGSFRSLPIEIDVNLDNVLYAKHPRDDRGVILHFVDGREIVVTTLSYNRAMKGE